MVPWTEAAMVEVGMVYFEGKANRAFRHCMWNKRLMDYFNDFNLTNQKNRIIIA